jgi:pimeloyl-ACP methyl ester carboxylesterase
VPVLDRTITVNGAQLAWGQWGEAPGPALLLVHGFSGSAHDFAPQIPALAAHRRVIAVDHRGHGRSAKLGDPSAYSVAQLRADLVAFADTVADEPLHVLGHSLGGYVTTWLAIDRPDLVRSLILMDTSAWSWDGEGRDAALALLRAFDPAAGLPPTGFLGPERELVAAISDDEWQAEKSVHDAAFDPWALKALGIELLSGDLPSARPRLGEVAGPVTVMAGSHDHPFVDLAPELASCFRDGHLEIIDGAYHSPQLTHPEQWRAIVEEHLARSG